MMIPAFTTHASRLHAGLLLLLTCLLRATSAAGQYPEPPPVLVADVKRGVDAVLDAEADGESRPADELEGVAWNDIVFTAVADAVERSGALPPLVAGGGGATSLSPTSEAIVAETVKTSPTTVRNVATYNYMAATSQTDKQLGATSGSSGTTTLIEKPSFSSLLALAVEHGAIEQQKNGTTLTLSTTPYVAAFALAPHLAPAVTRGTDDEETFLDTAANYERFGWLDRLGLAGTFALQEDENETGDDLKAEDFSSFSAKLRVFGDRTTRSSALRERWVAVVQPAIQTRLNVRTAALSRVFNAVQPDGSVEPSSEELDRRRTVARDRVLAKIEAYLASHKSASRETKERALTAIVLEEINAQFLNPITAAPGDAERIDISPALRAGLRDQVEALIATKPILDQAERDLRALIEEHQKSPIFSIGYTLTRSMESTDFSEVTLLGEGTFGTIDAIVNAAVSFNHDPDPSLGQETVREYGGGISFEIAFANFLTGFMSQGSDAPVTAALAGKVSHLEDTSQTFGTAQLRFEIPIAAAFSLPLSFTYSSETEGSDDSEFRANVGFDFDSDKLLAFAMLQNALK